MYTTRRAKGSLSATNKRKTKGGQHKRESIGHEGTGTHPGGGGRGERERGTSKK